MIAVLAGGVGAARFARGLIRAVNPRDVTIVVNTGDDTVLHGLHISPDIDTVIYTLSNSIDPEKGWGLAGETWRAMSGLSRFADVAPTTSSAPNTWFNLGDCDLATHMYRTARLQENATLCEVTDEIRRAFGVESAIIPIAFAQAIGVVLYLLPRTGTLGAVLITAYTGGGTAIHLHAGDGVMRPILTGLLAWIGLALRDPLVRSVFPWRTGTTHARSHANP
jgi:hypothetical protein